MTLLTVLTLVGDLHLAKPCLWQDGSAEQGEGVVKVGLEWGGWGGVDPHMFPSKKERSRELQQFRFIHKLIR